MRGTLSGTGGPSCDTSSRSLLLLDIDRRRGRPLDLVGERSTTAGFSPLWCRGSVYGLLEIVPQATALGSVDKVSQIRVKGCDTAHWSFTEEVCVWMEQRRGVKNPLEKLIPGPPLPVPAAAVPG
jgi:hypothetical protein